MTNAKRLRDCSPNLAWGLGTQAFSHDTGNVTSHTPCVTKEFFGDAFGAKEPSTQERRLPPSTWFCLAKPAKNPSPKLTLQTVSSLLPKPLFSFLVLGGRSPDPSPKRLLRPGPGLGMLLLMLGHPRPLLFFPEPGPSFLPNKPWRPQSWLNHKIALVLQVQGSRSFLLLRPRPPSPSLKLLVPNKPAFVLGPPPLPRLPCQALGSPAFSCVLPQLFVFEQPWLMVALVGHRPRSPKDILG